MLILDVDHFTVINDEFGHQIGDLALRAICDEITSTSRKGDPVIRWRGKEFAVGLPLCNLDGAQTVAEKILWAVREKRHGAQQHLPACTVSIRLVVVNGQMI